MTPSSTWSQRLALMQLADSFFPSGSFTFSHGLETLIQSRQVNTAEEFQDFLELLLHQKVGPTDLVALGHAYRASVHQDLASLYQIDQRLFAHTLVEDTRQAQQKSGRALLMVARTTWPHPQLEAIAKDIGQQQCHGLHPIIFAAVGQVVNLSQDDTALAFLHGFMTGLCGAAIRLGLFGHLQAQQVLTAIAPTVTTVLREANVLSLEEMWACAPALEIAQMGHRQLNSRQFTN
ncbi:urease accessory protein UreF [Leptothoe sp. PORK10 BA2]|uniref:urease accessory protein UreF n=1 Tax=Leptothoe sp. PORK10 BA2 TaxID=3110254 RepID=UPI002B20A005|nr:urease accessory UreF family protein [Leptothoe sp. PORK10 BA2]MEA5463787.1 urease accessory UreF family protein [Leptothoe sp. PORK10 BA2]